MPLLLLLILLLRALDDPEDALNLAIESRVVEESQ